MWWREDVLHVRSTVPGVDGVTVEQAFLRLANTAPDNPLTGRYRPADEQNGEALLQMASESLAADGDHDRATVVVHIAATDLTTDPASSNPMLIDATGNPVMGWDTTGRRFHAADIQRLLCDTRIQPCLSDADGVDFGVGRVTRTIPHWLRRVLQPRDNGCRFPGCDRTRWLHAHHIIHWAQGGPTNLDNLALLCGFHHRMIHNASWTINGNPNTALLFRDRWGHEYARAPDPIPGHDTDLAREIERINERAANRVRELTTSGSPPGR